MPTAVAKKSGKPVAPAPVVDAFTFENIIVEKFIAHRIFARGSDKATPPPVLATKLVNLSAAARDTLQKRITDALGNKSHGIEMSIESTLPGSFFQTAAALIHATDAELVSTSAQLAISLTTAQSSTSAPGGILAIVKGRVGASPKRFLAVLKADLQDGFAASEESNKEIELTYIESLLLTQAQKLYKVGLLVELTGTPKVALGTYGPGNYRAFLFDHLITASESRSAANYFYSIFLGMGIQASSRKLTQDFFDRTRDFIDSSSLTPSEKLELKEAVRVELRSSSNVISTDDFSKAHIADKALRKEYRKFMTDSGFPQSAVVKDTEFVRARLRAPRKMLFTSGVRIMTPGDLPADTVRVVGQEDGSTIVSISGAFQGGD